MGFTIFIGENLWYNKSCICAAGNAAAARARKSFCGVSAPNGTN